MSKYHLSDLGDKFEYCYDTGENYDFDCKVMKRKVNVDYEDEEEADLAFVVKGAGQGIFENDHYTMWRYFDGLIDPNSNEENDEQRLPMNLLQITLYRRQMQSRGSCILHILLLYSLLRDAH